jgi:hypothetical protein
MSRVTATTLSPLPEFQFVDQASVPLCGGLLYIYAAGTSTPLDTYTDFSGSTAHANSIVLDTSGRASVWLAYAADKMTDNASNLIRTLDQITTSRYALLSQTFIVSADAPYGQAIEILNFTAASSTASNDTVYLRVIRNDAASGDTNTDSCLVLSVRLLWVGEGPNSGGSDTYTISVW